jgi:hypothetical protein
VEDRHVLYGRASRPGTLFEPIAKDPLPTDRSRVAVFMDVADTEAVMDLLETPAAAEAMEYDGVLVEPLVFTPSKTLGS